MYAILYKKRNPNKYFYRIFPKYYVGSPCYPSITSLRPIFASIHDFQHWLATIDDHTVQ